MSYLCKTYCEYGLQRGCFCVISVAGRSFVRIADAGKMGDPDARSCCARRWMISRMLWILFPVRSSAGLRAVVDDSPRVSMLNPFDFVERFMMEQVQTGVEDVGETPDHFPCLMIDFVQDSYVLKDAVRHRRTWTDKVMFELFLLACGPKAFQRNNDSNDTLAKSMSATSKLGEARLTATK